MVRESPYKVSVPGGKIPLIIMDAKYGVSAAFALMGSVAEHKVAIRIGGGCKGMSDDDKEQMIDFFIQAFQGYEGVVWSGATRQVNKEGKLDPMVTDVPGIIAQQNPGCVALGTLPRTDMLTLQEDSRLVLDEYGTSPNPTQHGILIVQDGPDEKLGWNGDVTAYLKVMEMWKQHGKFSKLGLIAWNGGPITKEEIESSSSRKWLTVLVAGSGRVTDEIIAKIRDDDEGLPDHFKGSHVVIISKNNPDALREVLIEEGFFLS